jgi:hypothetical protein
MEFSPERLLKELDQPERIDWALELRHGEPAYDFLTGSLRGGSLNHDQAVNAVHALFKVWRWRPASEALETFVGLAEHPDIDVRSEALGLAVGLVRFLNSTEPVGVALSADQLEALDKALKAGRLTPKAAHYIRDFLTDPEIPDKRVFFQCDNGHLFSGEKCPWDGWSDPSLPKVLSVVARFKADEVELTVQGLIDSGIESRIVKRIVLAEFGSPQAEFEAICPGEIARGADR